MPDRTFADVADRFAVYQASTTDTDTLTDAGLVLAELFNEWVDGMLNETQLHSGLLNVLTRVYKAGGAAKLRQLDALVAAQRLRA